MRIPTLNILLEPTGMDYLKELYAKVIQNVERATISSKLKNRDLSGDPEAGSVVCKRFANSQSREYGTARAAGKGKQIKALDVTVPIDIDREIIEELEHKDVKLYGVDGVLDRRSVNHIRSMANELDFAFFEQGALEAEYFAPADAQATVEEVLEEMLQYAEATRNEYVRGVPRDMLHLVLDAVTYGEIRNSVDRGLGRTDVSLASEDFGDFHGAKVYKSLNMPVGVKAMLMIDGAIAQPVMANSYNAEKIGLSNAYAVELFYSYGVKVTTPDLIWVWADKVATPKSLPLETDFTVSQVVRLSCATPEAVVYYTLDGTNPATDDLYNESTNPTGATHIYSAEDGIVLSATKTIKAMATKANFTNSDVLEVTYTKL